MRRRGVTAAERDRPVDLLDPTARVFVKQHVEHFEALTGFETENTYDVYATADGAGAPLYRAKETSNVCCRQLCKSKRPFVLNLSRLDNGATFLRFERSYRCYWESLGVIDTAHGDISLGSVDRAFAFFSRSFTVKDAAGMARFTINSPMFDWWTFHITDVATGARVGAIRKKWSGLAQELFTDADNFGIEWPRAMGGRDKALLLGAVFLIDFMYFEDNDMNSTSRQRRGGGRGRGGGGGFGAGFGAGMF